MMVNKALPHQNDTGTHLWLGLFNYTYLLFPYLVLYLFKAKAPYLHPENGWRWGEYLPCLFPWHVLSHVINLLSLPFTMCLYLTYRGKWLDLTCGSSGVYEWDQNSSFKSAETLIVCWGAIQA
jgi:hypothetical protein